MSFSFSSFNTVSLVLLFIYYFSLAARMRCIVNSVTIRTLDSAQGLIQQSEGLRIQNHILILLTNAIYINTSIFIKNVIRVRLLYHVTNLRKIHLHLPSVFIVAHHRFPNINTTRVKRANEYIVLVILRLTRDVVVVHTVFADE